MDEIQAGEFWNQNAETWTLLARAGYDVYRDHLNTPAFFQILPDVNGLQGIDIGCGEGYNTRLLAQRGAIMEAIDIAENFIAKAQEEEHQNHLGIKYGVASATQLPFQDHSFDFATSFMCLMDIPNPENALREAYRVLKPNGFFQFSITHPCFITPHRRNLRNPITRKSYAIEIGDYFKNPNGKVDEWIFGEAPPDLKYTLPKFKTPLFHWTLTQWITAIIHAGFVIEQINEPFADDATIKKVPALQDTQVVAYFLHIRCRKKG